MRGFVKQGVRTRAVGTVSLIAIAAAVMLACGGGTAANGGSTTAGSTGGSEVAKSSQQFKAGDQVKVGDTYVVTVNAVKTSQGDAFIQPKSDNTYLIMDVSLKNVSSQEQHVSSLLMFTLKDATGQKYTETFVSGATPPDGKLAAGDTLRGQLAYEVPQKQHNFTLAFEADILSSGQTIWDLSV